MLSNSILFQDLILAPLINDHGMLVIHEVQHLTTAINALIVIVGQFKGFITQIVTPLLIISGLATGVRS